MKGWQEDVRTVTERESELARLRRYDRLRAMRRAASVTGQLLVYLLGCAIFLIAVWLLYR